MKRPGGDVCVESKLDLSYKVPLMPTYYYCCFTRLGHGWSLLVFTFESSGHMFRLVVKVLHMRNLAFIYVTGCFLAMSE